MPSLPPIRPEDEAVAARLRPRGAFDAAGEGPHDAARVDYLLRLGDDSLILGQRLGEWCGHAPSVEVDLSLANMALDLIGQATLFLDKANNDDGDELAFKRDVLDFATAGWSSSPTVTLRAPYAGSCSIRPGSTCCSSSWPTAPTPSFRPLPPRR